MEVGSDNAFDVDTAISHFVARTVSITDTALVNLIRSQDVRIIQVSRARYNPRFRGRLVVAPKAVRGLLVHSALCLAISNPAKAGTIHDVLCASAAPPRRPRRP